MSKGNRMTKGEKAQRWLTEKSPFPSRLRNLMETRGVTQQELAEAVGVTRQSISMYAGGQTVPDIYTVQLIADFFKVGVTALLGDQSMIRECRNFKEICTSYLGDDFYKLILDIHSLTDEGRNKIIERVAELREIPRYNVGYYQSMDWKEIEADRMEREADIVAE